MTILLQVWAWLTSKAALLAAGAIAILTVALSIKKAGKNEALLEQAVQERRITADEAKIRADAHALSDDDVRRVFKQQWTKR